MICTPTIWPLLLTILLFLALATYSWRRRNVPGALPFTIACLFGAAWMASFMMEYAAVDLATKVSWAKFRGLCGVPIITAVTCFVLDYTWPGRWLTRRNLALLSIPVLLSAALILTNDSHHLIWIGLPLVEGAIQQHFGLASWFGVVYCFVVLGAVNLVAFGWLFLRSPQHRLPVAAMVVGQITGRMLFLLARSNLFYPILPIDMFGLTFEFLMYALALFGFRILDPIPLARQTAIEQLQAGMLVLDPLGNVVSLNPAARRILGISASQAKGRPIRDLLPAYPDEHRADRGRAEIEFSLSAGQEIQYFTMEISPLNDWRGLEVGHLVMLLDLTEQKQAQAQILEQQRALAALQERERLARELHDGIGQVLGYVKMQAQAIANWVHEGETGKAEAQLATLAGVAQDAHTDLRGSILSLRSGDPASWSFLAALQHYLAAFQDNYGICAGLILSPNLAEDDFPPGVGVQLVRVIQEALTNARNHAKAQNVRVIIDRQEAHLTIEVTDDGVGFDLHALPNDGQRHYGLAFMQERVEQLGGVFRVESMLAEGTRVIVEIPVNGVHK